MWNTDDEAAQAWFAAYLRFSASPRAAMTITRLNFFIDIREVLPTVRDLWRRTLRRRSQRAYMNWEKMRRLVDLFFPPIRILHPMPCHRFDARTRGRSPVR